MSEPRIVTPEEALRTLASINMDLRPATVEVIELAHTVATEPDRIAEAERRGAVKALRRMGDLFRNVAEIPGMDCRAEGDHCHIRADSIENGADL